MSEFIMNPISNPCFCLILNHYGRIISVYIGTILHWFGSLPLRSTTCVTRHRRTQREVVPARLFFSERRIIMQVYYRSLYSAKSVKIKPHIDKASQITCKYWGPRQQSFNSRYSFFLHKHQCEYFYFCIL